MAAAVRIHVSERGGDPSRPVLIAFGGAGPMHVANLAAKLAIRRILVPLRAGVLSALGLLLAPAAFDIARTRKTGLDRVDFAALADEVGAMRAEIAAKLAEVEPGAAPAFTVALGLGYVGQSYQVPVPVPEGSVARLTRPALLADFAAAYRARYGHFYDDVPVELVTVHVAGSVGGGIALTRLAAGKPAPAMARRSREAYSRRERRFMSFAVYDRDSLGNGASFAGPALVEEDSATTVIDAGATVTVDAYGSLDIALPETE